MTRKLDVALGALTTLYVLALLISLGAAIFTSLPWSTFVQIAGFGLVAWLLLAMVAAILFGASAQPRSDER